jgi:hypothetical protein
MTRHAGHIHNYQQHTRGGPVTSSLLSMKEQKMGKTEIEKDKTLYAYRVASHNTRSLELQTAFLHHITIHHSYLL